MIEHNPIYLFLFLSTFYIPYQITKYFFIFYFSEEIVTKKKTELTTTKQIETRVKRQVILEDGKVVQDSGPIVETNTTEDTNKQESESVEVCVSILKIIFFVGKI